MVWVTSSFKKLGPLWMQIWGTKEEAPPGVAGGLLCSLLWVLPFPEEIRVQGRCCSHWGYQFGRTAGIEARGHLLPPGVSQEFGGGEHEGALPWVPNRRVAEVGDLEGSSVWNTKLMAGANHGTWVDNYKKLACEVWASFWLPKRMSEQCQVKNHHQASPAPPCLCWKNFLLPPDSIFTCWDIWEIQHEKTVAYAQALQFWAEKVDPPTGGKPCLLVGSGIELWEEMKCYLSFSNEDVFKGIALPEETPSSHPRRSLPRVPSQHQLVPL